MQGEGKSWSSKVICITSPLRTPCQLLVATESAVYFSSENTYYDKLSSRLLGNKRKQTMVLSRRQVYSTQRGKKEIPQNSEL